MDRRCGQMAAQPRGLRPGVLGQSELDAWTRRWPVGAVSMQRGVFLRPGSWHFTEVSELLFLCFLHGAVDLACLSDLPEAIHLVTWVCTATPRRPLALCRARVWAVALSPRVLGWLPGPETGPKARRLFSFFSHCCREPRSRSRGPQRSRQAPSSVRASAESIVGGT